MEGKKLHLYIAGRGSMARAIESLCQERGIEHSRMDACAQPVAGAIAIHVGSKRRLEELLPWCKKLSIPLIWASSGCEELLPESPEHPIVFAPNLALPVIELVEKTLPEFKAGTGLTRVSITESHQAGKTSPPGTALEIARVLEADPRTIRSIRDPGEQLARGIPERALDAHSAHWVSFENEDGSVAADFSVKVFGRRPYADGAVTLVEKIINTPLENKMYSAQEILDAPTT